jgi:hypothetical protein
MQRWYTVKVKYNKKGQGNEDSKKVNEAFLLPAVSFTDAEARINKEIGQTADGEFLVHAMSLTEVQDIFRNEDGGQWYMCKITISYEDNGKVTKVKQNYMVEALSVQDATTSLDSQLEDAMFDYETTNVALSNIIDVFYQDLDREISRTPLEESAE